MNKKGEIEVGPAVMAILAGILAWIMAKRMDASTAYTLVTALLTMVSAYFVVWSITNQ